MLLFIVLQFALARISTGQDYNSTNYDLATVLASHPQLSTFTANLSQVPWLLELATNANCTILAPSNDAFTNYNYSNGDDIEAVLSYHVLQGIHTLVDLQNTDKSFIPTELTDPNYSNVTGGQRVGLIPQGDDFFFEGGWKTRSKVITVNLPYASPNATNGVYEVGAIHIIDSVLNIPLDQVNTEIKANLEGPLSVELTVPFDPNPEVAGVAGDFGEWTLFAPNTLGPYSTENMTNSEFYKIEEYHLVKGSVLYSPDLTNGLKLRTVEGADITITTASNGTIYVNDVHLLYADYLLSNGVLHVIDHPLNPNDTSARPDFVSNNTTTTNTTITVSPTSTFTGLSTGAKVGIGVGVGLGALLVLGLLAWYFPRSRQRKNAVAAPSRRGRSAKRAAVEMEQSQTHELQTSKTGQSWEMDGQGTQRWRVYEMQ